MSNAAKRTLSDPQKQLEVAASVLILVEPPEWADDRHAFYRDADPYCVECHERMVITIANTVSSRPNTDSFFELLVCQSCEHEVNCRTKRGNGGHSFSTDGEIIWA